VLHIVPPHDDELALPVDVEGVDDAKPGLPGAPARGPHASRKQGAHDQEQHQNKDHDDDRAQHVGRGNTKFVKQGLHHSFHPAGRVEWRSRLILTH
jgi:hypothetical protein